MSIVSKFKESRLGKWLSVAAVSAAIAAMGVCSAFAADPETSGASGDISNALTSSFGTMKDDILGYIVVVLPIALAVVGVFFGIKKAIGFFKSTASK